MVVGDKVKIISNRMGPYANLTGTVTNIAGLTINVKLDALSRKVLRCGWSYEPSILVSMVVVCTNELMIE